MIRSDWIDGVWCKVLAAPMCAGLFAAAVMGLLTSSAAAGEILVQAPATATRQAEEITPGKPIDLLRLVRLPEHVFDGRWRRLDAGIACESSHAARFFVPVAVSGSYRLECDFTRRTGRDFISVKCPVGQLSTSVVLSGYGGQVAGLAALAGVDMKDLKEATGVVVRPGEIMNAARHSLVVDVTVRGQKATLAAKLNGTRFIAWSGPIDQLTAFSEDVVPSLSMIAFVSHHSVTDVHRLELTLQRGAKGLILGDDFYTPLYEVADEPPPTLANHCFEHQGKKYFISPRPVNYSTAQFLARQLGGRLLTISSPSENEFILRQGRGLVLWMSGWRAAGSREWRDDRNRPLRPGTAWAFRQPNLRPGESVLAIQTTDDGDRGWHDWHANAQNYACIEWGPE